MDETVANPSRRRLLSALAVGGVAAVAGCGHPAVVLDLQAASSETIADELSTTAESGSEAYAVVRTARENGSATRTGRRELFDRAEAVRVDDAFYEVSATRVGSGEVTVYDVRIDFDPADPTAERGDIAVENLPEADRQRLESALSDENPPDGEGYDIGVEYGSAEEVGDESVLVPDQEYDILVEGDDRYRVEVDSRTAEETTYRYEVSEVAPTVEAYAAGIRERYLFALDGLSEAERAVVDQAIEGGYFEDDDAFQSVIDRIRDHEALSVDEFYGTWLLEYDESEYVTYAEW
ncbi:hypothetical protein C475_09944 [Halosimplex carlsbadense 2-9-1]|uniref:Uncharacterized protein n=1 Tax=Halosimplex carlsbadense 2-9-1 TaxID=797114 RepID=M0CTM6_9EURY|nr:hypothetical protein [Halosimplex carlsbadense]ELZ25772.1 hypothetical protein C475_09944 [Halosimplex carlsbadense 2-9-1]